jgi:hypothetical protein
MGTFTMMDSLAKRTSVTYSNMKKLLLLLFSLLISFNSYGEWERVSESDDGAITTYIDMDTIKEHEGYVYFWELSDYLKPDEWGDMSLKAYVQADCGVNRQKFLSFITYQQPMGKGSSETTTPPDKWYYPSPGTIGGISLGYVCDYVD